MNLWILLNTFGANRKMPYTLNPWVSHCTTHLSLPYISMNPVTTHQTQSLPSCSKTKGPKFTLGNGSLTNPNLF